MLEYVKEGIYNKGIISGLVSTTWTKGLFKFKHMQADCYKCETCGAEWQSDPYEIT